MLSIPHSLRVAFPLTGLLGYLIFFLDRLTGETLWKRVENWFLVDLCGSVKLHCSPFELDARAPTV